MALISKLSSALRQAARRSEPLLLSTTSEAAASIPAFYVALRGMASSRLFVGGLSWSIDDSTLKDEFSYYGEVLEARVVKARDTGRSRGFGFVTYTNEKDAEAAREAWDGNMLDGRFIKVDYSEERPVGVDRGLGGTKVGYGGGNMKSDRPDFIMKDNLGDKTNALDQNSDTNHAGFWRRKSHEEGHSGEALLARGWKRF